MNYCRRCGSPLKTLSAQENVCENNHTIYQTAAPATGIFFVLPDGRVLLSRRGIEPKKGMLDAVGGFVGLSETFEEAIVREVKEELGLITDDYGPLNYLTSVFVQYSYGGENVPALSCFYWSQLRSTDKIKPQDDVAEVALVAPDQLDMTELANDDIRQAFETLKQVVA